MPTGSSDVTLVKPHGCILEAERDEAILVFTTSQYDNFSTGRPNLERWLTAILATHHVLYLGYGLNDGNVLHAILKGRGEGSLRRTSKARPPGSLAVLGMDDRPDFLDLRR